MAILHVKAERGGDFNEVVDSLFEGIPGIVEFLKGQVSFVHKGSSVMASGEPHYIGIDINLPDFEPNTIAPLKPLFDLLFALIAAQSGSTISAQIVFDGPDGQTVDVVSAAE